MKSYFVYHAYFLLVCQDTCIKICHSIPFYFLFLEFSFVGQCRRFLFLGVSPKTALRVRALDLEDMSILPTARRTHCFV